MSYSGRVVTEHHCGSSKKAHFGIRKSSPAKLEYEPDHYDDQVGLNLSLARNTAISRCWPSFTVASPRCLSFPG